jgi:hypothetical protein
MAPGCRYRLVLPIRARGHAARAAPASGWAGGHLVRGEESRTIAHVLVRRRRVVGWRWGKLEELEELAARTGTVGWAGGGGAVEFLRFFFGLYCLQF